MVTEEELSQMSPEELAEFQKKNCVFCRIAAGEIPARTVYSDSESIAVLDINPAAKGHMLLLPKEHYSVMPQLPEPLIRHLSMVCKGLARTALKAMKGNGTTIFIANGAAAGQHAPHFMIHIIPRKDGDGAFPAIPEKDVPKKVQEKVKTALAAAFGKKQKIAAGRKSDLDKVEIMAAAPETPKTGKKAKETESRVYEAEVSTTKPKTRKRKSKKTRKKTGKTKSGKKKGTSKRKESTKKTKKEGGRKEFDLDSITDLLTK